MKRFIVLASTLFLTFEVGADNSKVKDSGSSTESRTEQPVLLTSPPFLGTFYSAQFPDHPPLPAKPFPDLDVYSYKNIFIFDDRQVDYVTLRKEQAAERSSSRMKLNQMSEASAGPGVPGEGDAGGGGESDPPPIPFSYTDGLWLSIYGYDTNWMTLLAHGTIADEYYEILTKTNLSETNWTVDHGFIGNADLTLANPISVVGQSNFFFWARNSSLDTDGDGLPDWWEIEHDLSPALSDTGNTGTPDGYKDADGDGWTNVEEFQNGTSPSGFNEPPAPRGLNGGAQFGRNDCQSELESIGWSGDRLFHSSKLLRNR